MERSGRATWPGKAARVAVEPSGSERDTTPAFSLNPLEFLRIVFPASFCVIQLAKFLIVELSK
jgi:hypothetical protein